MAYILHIAVLVNTTESHLNQFINLWYISAVGNLTFQSSKASLKHSLAFPSQVRNRAYYEWA